MTARYRVSEKCFIAPYILETGSVIETDGPAAGYLEPLNEEATTAKEAWYNKEYKQLDRTGKEVITKPNLNKRFEAPTDITERQQVKLITAPPPEDVGQSLSLAESQIRPASPALVPQGDGTTSKLNVPSTDGLTSILEAAPAPKKDA